METDADRLCIYMGTDGTVPNRTASHTQMGPLRKRVLFRTVPNSSCVYTQKVGSHQVCLEMWQWEAIGQL